MTPHFADDWLTVFVGDCRDVLRDLPDESVQCVVTSPPYWALRDYGVEGQIGLEPTPEAYVATIVGVFREVRRVLRSDGTLWLNLGDTWAGGGNGGGGSFMAERPGWQHRANKVDRRSAPSGLKSKDLVGIPWRVAFALQADGWWLRSEIIWHKPNPMPEPVTDRPTKAHEQIFLLAKSERYHFAGSAIAEPVARGHAGSSFTSGKTGTNGLGRVSQQARIEGRDRNKRSVWTIPTQAFPDAHFATFPEALVEPCILAGCPQGGTVLDPFAGTGTVGIVAQRLSRRAVLIDLNPSFIDMAMRRNAAVPLGLETVA